jgi:hypothetical protein
MRIVFTRADSLMLIILGIISGVLQRRLYAMFIVNLYADFQYVLLHGSLANSVEEKYRYKIQATAMLLTYYFSKRELGEWLCMM